MAEQTPPRGLQVRPCGKLERHLGHEYPMTGARYGGLDAAGRVVPIPVTVTVYCRGAGR